MYCQNCQVLKLIILIKGGKVNDLKLFFNNLTDKGGDQQSGQQECLANLANQKQDQKIVAFGPSLAGKTVVGGDFGLGPMRMQFRDLKGSKPETT